MLKILMGPNVKILMGQSFGSWTHGHGPMALGAWAAAALPAHSHGPRLMCPGPGVKTLAHKYFGIWAHKYF